MTRKKTTFSSSLEWSDGFWWLGFRTQHKHPHPQSPIVLFCPWDQTTFSSGRAWYVERWVWERYRPCLAPIDGPWPMVGWLLCSLSVSLSLSLFSHVPPCVQQRYSGKGDAFITLLALPCTHPSHPIPSPPWIFFPSCCPSSSSSFVCVESWRVALLNCGCLFDVWCCVSLLLCFVVLLCVIACFVWCVLCSSDSTNVE